MPDTDALFEASREQFYIPEGTLYLDGNSLGLLSKSAERSLLEVLNQWRELAIGGWTDGPHPWFFLAEKLAEATAPLVGASPDAVIVTNSTTVNLHQLLATLLAEESVGNRREILIDAGAFPSDIYALHSFVRNRADLSIVTVAAEGGLLNEASILEAISEKTRMVLLPSVVYTSGQLLNMRALTMAAQKAGALIGFDCSHSVGAVPHEMDADGIDFAFWCGYKYLNGGPGAAAGLYLNHRHHALLPGLAGWFGSNKQNQLAMEPHFTPAQGAGALQIGTPNILSMAPLIGSLEEINRIGINRIRTRSLELNACLRNQVELHLANYGFQIITPSQPQQAGGHTAITHPHAIQICRALRACGVVPDYRPPNIVRLAPVALYTRFEDCIQAIEILREIMESKCYLEQNPERGLVP